MKMLAIALLASVLVGAVAPTAAMAQEQCLRSNMINGWKVVNDRNLVVIDRIGRSYDVRLAAGCTGLDWPMRLGFGTGLRGDSGLTCITRNDFVTVPANGGYPRQRCLINSVEPIHGPGPTAMNH